jgi:hypothetical protein
MVTNALRQQLKEGGVDEHCIPTEDRALVEGYIERIILKRGTIEIRRISIARRGSLLAGDQDLEPPSEPPVIFLPRTASTLPAAKGILHTPPQRTVMSPETRHALLEAIAKARVWVEDLVARRVNSLAEIASLENKVERHVRLLASLAFVPPRLIREIIEGSAKPDLTITSLANMLPFLWGQEVLPGS